MFAGVKQNFKIERRLFGIIARKLLGDEMALKTVRQVLGFTFLY
jgi:hypothetical protein